MTDSEPSSGQCSENSVLNELVLRYVQTARLFTARHDSAVFEGVDRGSLLLMQADSLFVGDW